MKTRSVHDGALGEALRTGYWRPDSAELVVAAWERSGETLAAFARRYGLRRDRLSRCRRRPRRSPWAPTAPQDPGLGSAGR